MKNCGFFVFLVFDKNKNRKPLKTKTFALLVSVYRKDVFMFFVDRVELGIFNEIVRVAHDEIKTYGFDEIFGYAENEIKSTHRRKDFIR